MKPKIYKNSKLPIILSYLSPMNWLSVIQGQPFVYIWGITILWFIFIIDEGTEEIILHESIHVYQGLETFFIGFYLLYIWDWLIGLWKYRDSFQAYTRIRSEQEAYANQHNSNYLNVRIKRDWIKKYKV